MICMVDHFETTQIETVKLSKKTKAFSNGNPSAPLMLDDIKDGAFSSRMCGINVPVSFMEPDSALGYNNKVYEDDGGSVTNIIVEFQVRDGTYTKCVVVSFENGADGIYATALGAKYTENAVGYEFYKQNRTWNSGITDYDLSENFGGGYGAFDMRVEVPTVHEWTLDGDKTWSALRGSETVAADEVVRISVTDTDAVLTVDEDVSAAGVVFVDGAGATLKINSGCTVSADSYSGLGYVLNNGTFVKRGEGAVEKTVIFAVMRITRNVWRIEI